jgi:Cyclophilin type peptidyl-prolyl cis-trans isomerase/CLD
VRPRASSLYSISTQKITVSSSRAPISVGRRLLSTEPGPPTTPPLPPPKGNNNKNNKSSLAWQVGTVFAVFGAYVVGMNLTEIAAKVDEEARDVDGSDIDCAVTSRVYFDMSVGGQEAGRIVVGLFGNAVPKTVANFETLAAGDTVHPRGAKLAYAGSTFHRIIPDFMVRLRCTE